MEKEKYIDDPGTTRWTLICPYCQKEHSHLYWDDDDDDVPKPGQLMSCAECYQICKVYLDDDNELAIRKVTADEMEKFKREAPRKYDHFMKAIEKCKPLKE